MRGKGTERLKKWGRDTVGMSLKLRKEVEKDVGKRVEEEKIIEVVIID